MSFKMVKDKTLSNWEGEADISNVGLLHAQTDKWAKLWQEQSHSWDLWQAELPIQGTMVRPAVTPVEIREASKSFKVRTTLVEGWHPRHFGMMSDSLLTRLGHIWHMCEVAQYWPECEAAMLAKLIPKASGGLRPIVWFRSGFRVFARSRRQAVRE